MDVLTVYVGQGELVVLRHGMEGIVIDSRLPDTDDVSAEAVQTQLGLVLEGRRVPGLILTSFDSDHCDPRGVDFVLGRFEPDWIMYPKYYKDTDCASAVFDTIEKHERLRVRGARPLRRVSVRLDRVDRRLLEGLSSDFDLELFSPHIEDMDSSNNCSIVMRVAGRGVGGFSYLVTGDTENARWERINSLFGTALRSDVLSAPHHGSRSATNAETLLLVDPNTVLISAGVDNQYGHPHPQAVAAFQKVAKHIHATNIEEGVSLFTKQVGDDFFTRLVR
ncbi:MAG: hypothetical protein WEF50_10570 [Myxococcota bacterium]